MHNSSHQSSPRGQREGGIPTKLTSSGMAQRSRDANARANKLPPEEQMSRFLQWLKVTDAGHQPC
jgi:hypothetical protein